MVRGRLRGRKAYNLHVGGPGILRSFGWKERKPYEAGTLSYRRQLNSGLVIVNSPIQPMN